MKFYGNGLVWDASKNRLLCEFTKAGVLETEDTYICEKLVSLGYRHDSYMPKSEADKVVEAVHEIMHTLAVAPDQPEPGITGKAIYVDPINDYVHAPDQPEPVARDAKPADTVRVDKVVVEGVLEVKPKRGKK